MAAWSQRIQREFLAGARQLKQAVTAGVCAQCGRQRTLVEGVCVPCNLDEVSDPY
jgi:hypothetical protein